MHLVFEEDLLHRLPRGGRDRNGPVDVTELRLPANETFAATISVSNAAPPTYIPGYTTRVDLQGRRALGAGGRTNAANKAI
jgi:hypothetical protein